MEAYATKHGDHDLVRLGLFIEMPYLTYGKVQKPKISKKAVKLIPIYGSVPKSKCGNQDGYFEEVFKRLFEGENKKKKTTKKKIVLKTPFIPAGPGKIHSTPNDYFGCFVEEPPERFSPLLIKSLVKGKGKKSKRVLLKPNPLTNPVKKGGPGYVDICLGPYPEHMKDPYGPKPLKKNTKRIRNIPFYSNFAPKFAFTDNPYVDEKNDPPKKPLYYSREKIIKSKNMRVPFIPAGPGKEMGNNHDGCFTPFPEFKKDPYMTSMQIENFVKGKKKDKKRYNPFVPPFIQLKTLYDPSILVSTDFQMNQTNWTQYSPKYVQYL